MSTTRAQRRNLASLVLMHGYDNTLEFWGEIIGDSKDFPGYYEARQILDSWHAQIIALADKDTR